MNENLTLDIACDFINGGSWSSNSFSEEGYPVVKVSNIKNDTIDNSSLSYLDPILLDKYKKNILRKNDVILATVGSHPSLINSAAGRSISVSKQHEGFLLNQNAVCIRTKDSSILSQKYLGYLIRENKFKKSIQRLGRGAANQMRIPISSVKKLKINLPSISTQNKIASILSAYDDLIENNLKRIQLIEEKAQLTYEEWFVRMKYPGHENDSVDSETDLPEGWYMKKLKDECEIIMGQSPKSEYYNHEAKGLPFHQGVKDYGFRFPKNTTWSTSGNRIANEGSILFSVRAPVGRINVSREKIILGRGLASINHKRGFNSFVLYQLMNIFYRDNLIGEGTIYSSVTKKNVEDIKLVVPDESITKKFNAMAEKIDKAIFTLTKKKKLLEESRELLIPRLMSGMIDIDEIKYNYPKETFA